MLRSRRRKKSRSREPCLTLWKTMMMNQPTKCFSSKNHPLKTRIVTSLPKRKCLSFWMKKKMKRTSKCSNLLSSNSYLPCKVIKVHLCNSNRINNCKILHFRVKIHLEHLYSRTICKFTLYDYNVK
jgi:hypothetical protein